jgi:flagellar motor protein MotB
VQAVENIERTSDMQRFVQPMKGILSPAATAGPLKDIQAELEKALAPEIRSRVVDIKTRKEGLVVSLREVGFYDSGAPTMRASSVGSIDGLVAVLASRSENMRIEGHTDNVPLHNTHFPSNWELSTSRATELVKLLFTDTTSLLRACPLRAMPNSIPSRKTPRPTDALVTGVSISSF